MTVSRLKPSLIFGRPAVYCTKLTQGDHLTPIPTPLPSLPHPSPPSNFLPEELWQPKFADPKVDYCSFQKHLCCVS